MSDSRYYSLVRLIQLDIRHVDTLINLDSVAFITKIAFDVQQILEKVFKLILYSSNVSRSKIRGAGHDLSLLSLLICAQGIKIPTDVIALIPSVSKWESATRYDACFGDTLDVNVVLNAYSIVRHYTMLILFG